MKPETHLFIIWSKARYLEDKILNDISKELNIIKKIEITWDIKTFANNLKRFYGTKLTIPLIKMKDCGIGPFLLVIVQDPSPVYEYRHTSRGVDEYVNIKLFDRKSKYRKWIGKNTSKIHCTNSIIETAHDLMLLTGIKVSDDYDAIRALPDKVRRNIVGYDGWSSLEQLFETLNETIEYVVLRNYEYLPQKFNSSEHGDIDLMVPNLEEAMLITNAKRVFRQKYRVHCEVIINKEPVRFDFRYIGDGYYDEKWETSIIEKRQYNQKGFYIPDTENYKYSLLYHALVQKPHVSNEYAHKLFNLFGDNISLEETLHSYMKKKDYCITEPNDFSVYLNSDYFKEPFSKKRIRFLRRLNYKRKVKSLLKRT